MNTEPRFEKKYNDLVAGLEKMHARNVTRTRSALKSLLIIPTVFLILLFLTESSKTVFLILWIASMFIIATILVIVEYQDYLLRKMISGAELADDSTYKPTEELGASDDAAMAAKRIRESVMSRAPENDKESEEAHVN